jgi:hypothetical protein
VSKNYKNLGTKKPESERTTENKKENYRMKADMLKWGTKILRPRNKCRLLQNKNIAFKKQKK